MNLRQIDRTGNSSSYYIGEQLTPLPEVQFGQRTASVLGNISEPIPYERFDDSLAGNLDEAVPLTSTVHEANRSTLN